LFILARFSHTTLKWSLPTHRENQHCHVVIFCMETGIGSGNVNYCGPSILFYKANLVKTCEMWCDMNERDMHMNCSWSGYFYCKFLSIFFVTTNARNLLAHFCLSGSQWGKSLMKLTSSSRPLSKKVVVFCFEQCASSLKLWPLL